MRRRFWFLVVLAAQTCCSVFMSERLAVVELLVPFAIVVACRHYQGGWKPSLKVAMTPVVAIVVLIVGFAAFDAPGRGSTTPSPISSHYEFGAVRLEGYYVTAFNNAEVNWRHRHELYPLPYHTLEGFWEAPGISSVANYWGGSPGSTPTSATRSSSRPR